MKRPEFGSLGMLNLASGIVEVVDVEAREASDEAIRVCRGSTLLGPLNPPFGWV